MTEEQLRVKLGKIEALFAGAGTAGERQAAASAMERITRRLAEAQGDEPSAEVKFTLPTAGRASCSWPCAGATA